MYNFRQLFNFRPQFIDYSLMTANQPLPSIFVIEVLCALVAKTKSNQSQRREATIFKGPIFLPHV